jgi:thiol-disulfide isomerase/thioredoxin
MRNTKQISIQKKKCSKPFHPFGTDIWYLFRISDLRFGVFFLGFNSPSSAAIAALAAILLAAGQSIAFAANADTNGGAKSAGNDPFRVPDGTADELQKYIEHLKRISPPSSLRPAAEFRRQRAAAQLTACEKLLTVQPVPTPEQVRIALRAKIAALFVLEKLGDATATDMIEATLQQARQLTPLPPPPGQTASGQSPPVQPAPSAKLQGPPRLVRDVEFAILEGRAQQAAAMNGNQYGQLVARVAQFLKYGDADGDSADVAIQVAIAGEERQKREAAIAAYTEFGTILEGSDDMNVAAKAATLLGAARRLDLAGKPFVLRGATLAGRSADPKKLKGKVVLIDFFATWCGPCHDEIPNIIKCYRAYHKRGFEVVGVSVDRERDALADFLDKEKYPWTVLLDRYEVRGTDRSLATYYGIFTIPQMILVGTDGRVLSVDVRGAR